MKKVLRGCCTCAIVAPVLAVVVGVSLDWVKYQESGLTLLPDRLAASGWHFPLGVLAVVLGGAGVALVVDPRDPLYEWRKHGIILAISGILVALCALVHLLRQPVWWDLPLAYHGPGGYVTLGGGLLLMVSGLLMIAGGYVLGWPDPGTIPGIFRGMGRHLAARADSRERGWDWWSHRDG